MIVANAIRLPYRGGSAHMACTSPPYYQKRRYEGVEPLEWPAVSYSPMPGLPAITVPAVTREQIAATPEQVVWEEMAGAAAALGLDPEEALLEDEKPPGFTPDQCAGVLGLEPDPFAYIGHLVLVAREVWRVLRDDGVFCVNIGDTYAGSHMSGGTESQGIHSASRYVEAAARGRETTTGTGYKPKDMMGIPWRLAFALIADGWTLRSRMPGGVEMRPDVIWSKNAMPESVRDRPSVDFEDVFIFSKAKRYFWDQENGRTDPRCRPRPDSSRTKSTGKNASAQRSFRGRESFGDGSTTLGLNLPGNGANLRASWKINTEPTNEEHYAAWPRELVRRLIKIGTSDKGCCPECGAQWFRLVERQTLVDGKPADRGAVSRRNGLDHGNFADAPGHTRISFATQFLGWASGCSCDAGEPAPCRVLDPFSGIGRTGEVCYETGRIYMPAELSVRYAAIQDRRLEERRPGLEVERLKAEAATAGKVLGVGKMAQISGPLFAREDS